MAITNDLGDAPAVDGLEVTPNDSADLTGGPYRSLYVGGAGDGTLKVTMRSGTVLTFTGIGVGYHPLSVSRVWLTGTGVTGIRALK